MSVLQNAGIRVPRDVSVVGFDDIHFAQSCIPALTTIRQPINRMCDEAIKMLVNKQLENAPDTMICPVELIVRQSSGRAPL